MSGYWYLASPYSKYPGGIDAAFDAVVLARGILVRAGVPCFSPIIHSHPVAKACGIDPHDHAIWLPSERPILDGAAGLLILRLPSWEVSYGIAEEEKIFRAAGKPVRYMDPGTVPPDLFIT